MNRVYCLVLALLIFSNCSNKTDHLNSKLDLKKININVNNFREEGRLSDLVESIDILALETNNDCLIYQISKASLYNSNLYILDNMSQKLLRFNKKGKFLGQISKQGNGPEEYLEINDFYIDTLNRKIYIPAVTKILIYSLDGVFLKEKKINGLVSHASKIDKNNFVFYGNKDSKCIHIANEKFIINKSFFRFSPMYNVKSFFIFSKYFGKIIFHYSGNDTLFTFLNNKPTPYIYFDFNGKNFTKRDYENLSERNKNNLYDYLLKSGNYVRCLSFLAIDSIAHFGMTYAQNGYTGFLNMNTNEYYFVNVKKLNNDLFERFFYFHPVGLTSDRFIVSVPASKIINSDLSKLLQLNKKEIKKIDENSNPVLLFIKPNPNFTHEKK